MSILDTVRHRLNKRTDSEHQQAFLRLFIVSTAMFNVYFHNGWYFPELETRAGQASLLVISAVVISILIVAHIIYKPAINPFRRIVGMVHDVTAATMLLFLNGEFAALYLFVFPFITIGNGFRFGVKYLVTCALMSVVGLGWLFSYNAFWSQHMYVTWGLGINFLVVAMYTAYLLSHLQAATTKLQKLATHDQLTGLANRQFFDELLDHAILVNSRQNKTIGCLYFDLDGFKKVNDELGHMYGDLLLQAVAEKVKTCIRISDLFARLGGDEFSIILDPLGSKADAEMVAQRIIQGVESIDNIRGKKIKVSVSIGCVLITPLSQKISISTPEVVTQADENMYRSKKAGKGTYTITDFKKSS